MGRMNAIAAKIFTFLRLRISLTVDVDGAVSVYDNYCFTAVGATPVIGAVAATTTNPAGTTAGQTFTPTSNGAVETGANSKRVST
jgi:hypothetical protein